jgi:hypothetical protein
MSYTWGEQEMHTKFCFENLKGRAHLEEIDVARRKILKWFLEKKVEELWAGFSCLWIESSGSSEMINVHVR